MTFETTPKSRFSSKPRAQRVRAEDHDQIFSPHCVKRYAPAALAFVELGRDFFANRRNLFDTQAELVISAEINDDSCVGNGLNDR